MSNFIQNPPGMYYAIALGVVILLLSFLPEDKEEKKKPAAEAPAADNEQVGNTETVPNK